MFLFTPETNITVCYTILELYWNLSLKLKKNSPFRKLEKQKVILKEKVKEKAKGLFAIKLLFSLPF